MTMHGANSRNAPNVRFIRAQTYIWTQLRRYCEIGWETYCAEQGAGKPRPVSRSTPATVSAWCHRFAKSHDRMPPAIVGAAATFRSDFVRLIAVALPNTGIELPSRQDPVEKAIADSTNWESAAQVALSDVKRVTEVLQRTRPRWRVTTDTDPNIILDHVQKEYQCRLSNLFKNAKAKMSMLQLDPLTESGYIVVPVSPINEAIVGAFASGEVIPTTVDVLAPLGSDQHARTSMKGRGASSKVKPTRLIVFKQTPDEYLWNLLESNGALAIKAHYALWARWAQAYPKMDFTAEQTLSLTVAQFCDDLGFKQHKGDHRIDNKRKAVALLELLTSLEFICLRQSKQALEVVHEGMIWRRANPPEDLRGFEDVWSKTRHGFQDMWVNKAFSYAPGPMFADDEWRKQNQFNGRVGAALLELQADNRDKYTLKVGGYLISLARDGEGGQTKIRTRTLAEKTGMWRVDGKDNRGRIEDKVVGALRKLETIKVIKSYTYEPGRRYDFSSNDNWFNRVLVISWPDTYEGEPIVFPWITDKESWDSQR